MEEIVKDTTRQISTSTVFQDRKSKIFDRIDERFPVADDYYQLFVYLLHP